MHSLDTMRSASGRWGRIAGALAVAAGLLAAACSSSGATPTISNPEYSGFLAAREFVVGENRFPFVLRALRGGLLEDAQVQVGFYSFDGETPVLRSQTLATVRQVEGVTPHTHPDGELHEHLDVRKVYVVDRVVFDQPGVWGVQFSVTTADGQPVAVQGLGLFVEEENIAPGVGDPVPPSRNLTLADVESIEEIDTRIPPDDMHELSVAQALKAGKPFVVVFATPAFCITQVCGPVTDVVAELQGRYGDRVNFIHIEPWDLTLARTEGRLVLTEVALEWDLPSEPWVFVVGDDGRVAARFEGIASSEEIEAAILEALGNEQGGEG